MLMDWNPTAKGKSVRFGSVNEGASFSNVRPQGYLLVNGPRNALPRPKPRGVMATHESHKLKDHQTVANESNMASSHQFLNGINSHSHLFLILPLRLDTSSWFPYYSVT